MKIVKIMHNLLLFFAIKPCRDGGAKSEKWCQDAFNNAHERCLSLPWEGFGTSKSAGKVLGPQKVPKPYVYHYLFGFSPLFLKKVVVNVRFWLIFKVSASIISKNHRKTS